jgi:hypothetical protein
VNFFMNKFRKLGFIKYNVSVSGRPSGQADADDLSGAGRMFSRFRREVPGKQFFDAVDGMVGDA